MCGMRRVIFAALCAAALSAVPGTASAATNGQLVLASRTAPNALITVNPDGGGTRTLWSAAGGSLVSSPAWSRDGNRIAFVVDGRVKAIALATGAVTDLAAGTDPGWTPTGDVAFRRGQELLAVPAGGGAERTLGHLPDADTRALVWSPDGWIARVVPGGDVRIDALDGAGEDTIGGGAEGRPDWSPDGELLAYPAASGRIRVVSLDGDEVDATFGSADVSPAWSPDGEEILFRRGDQWWIADGPGSSHTLATDPGPWEGADWQPCVAGVTSSCVSARPITPRTYRCANPTINVRSGQQVYVPLACTSSGGGSLQIGGSRPTALQILTQPAHGSASIINASSSPLVYRAAAGYVGPDVFTVRAADGSLPSNDITVTVNVTPTFAALAAPKLNVLGQPKLDRRGRVVLRAVCTNACDVALRVIVRLNTQRVLKGGVVKASAASGGIVRLRLQRARLPRHRRIVAARIAGTLTGRLPVAGKLPQRTFTLSLIP
jgi:Tol biopolymer transport system component